MRSLLNRIVGVIDQFHSVRRFSEYRLSGFERQVPDSGLERRQELLVFGVGWRNSRFHGAGPAIYCDAVA